MSLSHLFRSDASLESSFLCTGLASRPIALAASMSGGTVVFMERELKSGKDRLQILRVRAMRLSTLKKKLERAKQGGCRLVGIEGSADTDHVAAVTLTLLQDTGIYPVDVRAAYAHFQKE